MSFCYSTEEIAIHLIGPPASEASIWPARSASFTFLNPTDPISQLHKVAAGPFLYSLNILEWPPRPTPSDPPCRLPPLRSGDHALPAVADYLSRHLPASCALL